MHIKKILILFLICLTTFTACKNKSSFTNLTSFVDNNGNLQKTPVKKSFIYDKEFEKNEKTKKILEDFKLIIKYLENKKEVSSTNLKNEKNLEFYFEGKKYDIVLETWDEFEKQREKDSEEKRSTPLLFIRKIDDNSSKLYEIDFDTNDGTTVLEMSILLNELINK